jgi:hypothetical protein
MFDTADIPITAEVLTLIAEIAEIDEVKGAWCALAIRGLRIKTRDTVKKSKPRRTRRAAPSSASPPARVGRVSWASIKPVPNGTASSPGGNLTNFAKTLQKGQLVSLEREIEYRAIKETAKGQQVKYTIAKIDAPSMRRLSKVEASDDPSDGANDV